MLVLLLASPLLSGSASAVVPKFTATRPDYQKPTGGVPLLPHAEHFTIFKATADRELAPLSFSFWSASDGW